MPEKNTYCKKCGGLIGNKTKKCDGCGKQYFHFSSRTFIVIAIAVVAIALIGLNAYQYIVNKQKVEQLEYRFQSIKSDKDNYLEELILAREEIAFWDSNVVICTQSGEKYHKYGCSHLVDRDYFVCTAEEAKRRGYLPCLDCCSAWDTMIQSSK